MRRQIAVAVGATLLFLAACSPSEPAVVPTLLDLNAIATNDAAATQTRATRDAASAQIAAATLTVDAATNRPPLPATWTPAPSVTAPPTETPRPSATPVTALGTLYFIFNGDSIAALRADGTSEKLILVGGAPDDLTLSPDGQLLAYTAQGSGSAREVFVTSLDGVYVQRVSCLGFARVVNPAWSADSRALAFAASQTPDGPLGLYAVSVAGSGNCPADNNQRLLSPTDFNTIESIIWSPSNDAVFFSSSSIYGYDLRRGLLYPQLTFPTGFGPDISPAIRPGTERMYYLKHEFDQVTRQQAGVVHYADIGSVNGQPLEEIRSTPFFARQIRWSRDGRFLIANTDQGIFVQDASSNTAIQVHGNGNFFPQAVFSPDSDWVAYVDGGRDLLTIPQVFVVRRDGDLRRQLTNHQEGTIMDLNWGG
jgi:hypothetical protein